MKEHLPTGIHGLIERQEAREKGKSFQTVRVNYTFEEDVTGVCVTPVLKAEPGPGHLKGRVMCAPPGLSVCVCVSFAAYIAHPHLFYSFDSTGDVTAP